MKQMMRYVAISVLLLSFVAAISPFIPAEVEAQEGAQKQACIGATGDEDAWRDADGDGEPECVKDGETNSIADIINTVINLLLSIAGAVAVIMLIIGGFRYVVSGGDSSAVEGAKNTILYAIIGLVVIFLSYAAVSFLFTQLT